VYAHPNPNSFCHAVLEQFTAGLKNADHTSEVIDLYAIKFDPVFSMRDSVQFIDERYTPKDVLDGMNLKQLVLDSSGGPLRRFILSRWLRNKDPSGVVRLIRKGMPKDVVAQQEKVAQAEGFAFIAPVFWLGFPAILKGWIEPIFGYGFAYYLTRERWRGELGGRVPLLHYEKALVINTTFFSEGDYKEAGLKEAMTTVIDDFGLRYPGVKEVDHVYFYGSSGHSTSFAQTLCQYGFDQSRSPEWVDLLKTISLIGANTRA
jgi:NAD(P)H dehydrogenase (quinone)